MVLNDIAPRDVTIWRAAVGVERAWSTFNTQACALKGGGHKPPPTTQQREEGGPRPASRWSRGEFIAGVGDWTGDLKDENSNGGDQVEVPVELVPLAEVLADHPLVRTVFVLLLFRTAFLLTVRSQPLGTSAMVRSFQARSLQIPLTGRSSAVGELPGC